MREIPDAIQWHEGMLLMPQHFQQFSGRVESLIQQMAATSGGYSWGVQTLEYDRTTLVSGKLRVQQVQAVLRDGFLVRAGTSFGLDLELDLTQFADQMRQGTIRVYLVVPANPALSARGDLARFESFDGEAVTDDSTGESAIPIPRLRARVGLWAGQIPPPRFEAIPLMEVSQQGETFGDSAYIPPCLTVPISSPLSNLCAAATSLVREKTLFLADQLRTGASKDSAAESAETRSRIQSLSAGLPMAEAALQSGSAHPFSLYLTMCNLAGHVARITFSMIPPQFSAYSHDNLRVSFQAVAAYIQQSVSDAVIESWRTYPFSLANNSYQVGSAPAIDAALAAGGTLDSPNLAIALRPGQGSTDGSAERWGESCVIGSSGAVSRLVANRVLGADRRAVERMADLTPPRGMVLFSLQSDPSAIKPGEPIQLLERSTDEPRPSEAVLYVRRLQDEKKGG